MAAIAPLERRIAAPAAAAGTPASLTGPRRFLIARLNAEGVGRPRPAVGRAWLPLRSSRTAGLGRKVLHDEAKSADQHGVKIVSAALATAIAAGVLFGFGNEALSGTWASSSLAFWLVTVAAGLCVPLALAVLVVGWKQATAELAVIGASLSALSVWSLAHGLSHPGYLVMQQGPTEVAALVALPAAFAVLLPATLGDRSIAQFVARHWRGWSVGAVVSAVLGASAVLALPAVILVPAPGRALRVASALLALGGAAVVAARHYRLYVIGRRRASLAAAVSVVYLSAAGAVGLLARPSSVAWWVAHGLDVAALVAASVSALVAYRRQADVAAIVAPVVNRDPLLALDLGLAPEVHAFVAALHKKDEITRDHVVRVGELAMRLGVRAGLSPSRLRAVGLAALLHDIGKLVIPSSIVAKPDRLTDEEFSVMKTHCERGAALLEASAVLRSVAPLVRAHHERPDGVGYPDGLAGEVLTMDMAIVSVCDAWDAMTNDRQYREGMTLERASDILRSGAGTQWRADVVVLLLDEVASAPIKGTFADVGRRLATSAVGAVCPDALPALLESAS